MQMSDVQNNVSGFLPGWEEIEWGNSCQKGAGQAKEAWRWKESQGSFFVQY